MSKDPLELTKQLVSIPSVNPFRTVETATGSHGIGAEIAIHEFLEALLQSWGFQTERQIVEQAAIIEQAGERIEIPARWNLLAEKGSGARSILFFGHTDTVDVKAGWETDPFTLSEKVVDGQRRYYGLGANDMKSGLAAVLCGIPDRVPSGVKVKLAFLVDEEFWSFGGDTLVRSSFLDDVDLAITPEIGECAHDCRAQQVGLGRLGREEFVVRVEGRACHGADAFVCEDAINAVHESVHLQAELIKYCRSAKREFVEEGGLRVLNAAYLNLHTGGRGMLSVPDLAECVVDRSFVPGERPEEELTRLRQFVADVQKRGIVDSRARLEVYSRPRPTPACKPYFFPRTTPQVQHLEKVIHSVGEKVEYFIGRSVADENRLAERGIVTLILSPVGAGSHTSHEWVAVESIPKLSTVVRALVQGYDAS